MSNNNKGPNAVPPRWLGCPRKGEVIANRFVPFKTPLDGKFSTIPPENLFLPSMFITSLQNHQLKIGLWIDLTYTSRFYDKEQIEKKGIKYIKLQCRGHGETPNAEQTAAFIQICRSFIEKSTDPNEVIAVHCTHGFNRTGFLICSYLIEEESWDIQLATQTFANARPPGIYKKDYLEELCKRFGEDDVPPTPLLPDWCYEDDDQEDDALDNGDNPTSWNMSDPRRKKEFQKLNPTFMEGIEGVTPVTLMSKVTFIQRKGQEFAGWKRPGFPGCQPVSMTRHNLHFLKEKNYQVSWKADGTRYMLLILNHGDVYFIDRDNAVFECKTVSFPKRKDANDHVKDTLVDGEMVIDEVDGVKHARYLIYDIVKFEGQDVGKCDFNRRMLCITRELVEPRYAAFREGRIDRSKEPFSVRRKDFWDLSATHTLFEDKFTKQVGHEIDGLIFQPVPDHYLAGRCDASLKWKPPTHNSIDFKLLIRKEDRPGMLAKSVGELYVGGRDPTKFGEIKVSKALRQYDRKIIECRWDYTNRQWVFMRERTDKSFPNAYDTAVSVWDSISNPITKETLLTFIEQHRWVPPPNDKRPAEGALMPPPKAPRQQL
ncbi:mRNA-capping enzyme [Halotydeus destructor]|nr:mRNA-capping enzyme [Halotydeus destructor]